MLNFKMILLALVISLSFLGLIGVKVYVHDIQKDIVSLESKKSKVKEEVQVLRAEWANLNRPDRLKALSEQYLKFEQISSNKIKYLGKKEVLYSNDALKIISIKNDTEYQQVQWRYKPREFIVKSR